MKKFKFLFILTILFIFNFINYSLAKENNLNILFTHDIHDHIEKFTNLRDDNINEIGGYISLSNKINEELEKDKDTLILDAGDYSMGTLFQTIYSTENPSLRLLGDLGFEATTLGNHEFDYKVVGLAESLNSAKNSGDRLPELLISNIDLNNYDNVQKSDVKKLKRAFDNYGAKNYIVINKKNYKIGIFGLIGYEAISNAPMAGINFKDPLETAKEITYILKNEEKVDLIICLSHSGTWDNIKKSEDEIMAKEVKDIDIIISGHTHTEIINPIIVGKTIIVSSGSYGRNLGKLTVEEKDNLWKIVNYNLIELNNNSNNKNLLIEEKIEYFKQIIEKNYLDLFNLKFNEVLGRSIFSFTPENELGLEHREEPLANLITDSYIDTIKKFEGDNYKKITASVVPYGTIRSSIIKGEITTSDIFNISSLGIGSDNIPGYPLIDVYLTGKELRDAAEVDASIQPLMSVAQLYFSGLHYTFNPNRLIFNKVTDIYIINENNEREEIIDNKLYRIVTGLYTAQMLSIVKDQSFGLLSIVPKNEQGEIITDFNSRILKKDNIEIKEWYALANFIQSFDNIDGIPVIPMKYSEIEGRKIVDNNSNITAIISNPNRIALGLYSIIILSLIIIFLFIRFLLRKKN